MLLGRRDNAKLTSWDDLKAEPGQRKLKVGVLESSAAQNYLQSHYADDVEMVVYEGTTDAMREVETGKLDATLADEPAVVFYLDRYPGLLRIGQPAGRGYYVMFVRQGDERLRDALDGAIGNLLADGRLEAVYRRYGLWNDQQRRLASLGEVTDEQLGIRATRLRRLERDQKPRAAAD